MFEDTNSAELGLVFGKKYWGNGYAHEAGNKIIDTLFNKVGVGCIFGLHDINNPKSGRAMQKLGMKYEGVIRHCNKKIKVLLIVQDILLLKRKD